MIYTAPSPSARTAGDLPDGLRSEELPVRPFDCVKTMHILPRNEKVAAALRQTCNSIVSRPYKVKRNNSPAAEIPTIFLQSLDYFLCGWYTTLATQFEYLHHIRVTLGIRVPLSLVW